MSGWSDRSKVKATEASLVFPELRDPRPEPDGWSSVCPQHPGALLQVRVRAGTLRSITCGSGDEHCAEAKRLRELAQ